MTVKLYWAPRTRAFRILWLLEETGAPYELARVDISAGAPEGSALRAVNPMGKVPALEDGETKVAESGAIALYLAERFPEAGLAPAVGNPLRGAYLHWLMFTATCLEPAMLQKMTALQLPEVSAGWGSFQRVMDVLEARLSQSPYVLGERFSAVDVLLSTDIHFGINLLKVFPALPIFTDYMARCQARPAFARAQAIEAAAV
ncbi:glutathione S-transferase family protein [Azorhizobium sp. AG788]|uniref:glutathione S-transferase family protein n=1 Tax=Azorhizobium sp. AG788 TaxID=2183897 RepID=UPI003139DEF5